MNGSEKLRIQHNFDTFGMHRADLEELIEKNIDRLPMFVAGLLSDIQELMVTVPDSKIRSEVIRRQLNVAKYALFNGIRL